MLRSCRIPQDLDSLGVENGLQFADAQTNHYLVGTSLFNSARSLKSPSVISILSLLVMRLRIGPNFDKSPQVIKVAPIGH